MVADHPIAAIHSYLNLEGYSVGVVLCFVGFGPPFYDFPPFNFALLSRINIKPYRITYFAYSVSN